MNTNDTATSVVITLRSIAIAVMLTGLLVTLMILWTQDVGMLDLTIEHKASCKTIEKIINDPVKLHVGMDNQELRELYRDKGCLDYESIRAETESRRNP